jgi:hypothetical protein
MVATGENRQNFNDLNFVQLKLLDRKNGACFSSSKRRRKWLYFCGHALLISNTLFCLCFGTLQQPIASWFVYLYMPSLLWFISTVNFLF